MLFSLASFSFILPLVLGQMTHNITVGSNGGLTFDPQTITAEVGDIVQFVFVAKNHTATQSSFNSPCSRLIGADGVHVTGFDSGFKPVLGDNAAPQIAFFQVENMDPLWFYCRQTGHCGKGMVFAVNPPAEGNTFEKFQAAAIGTASNATTTTSVATTTATSNVGSYTTPPPPPSVVTVTETVTLGASSWTTTYGSYPGSAAPTPNPVPVVHNVVVGGSGQLAFNPSNITAQPRDIIVFKFLSKNHTTTQSSFSNPCLPLGQTSANAGFDSGFMPTTDDALPPLFFNVTVNDTAPIWVYCKQTAPSSHCGAGMVFSVNAIESGPNNFGAFQNLAKHVNGTSSTPSSTTSSAAPSNTSKDNGSMRKSDVGGAGVALVAVVFAMLLI